VGLNVEDVIHDSHRLSWCVYKNPFGLSLFLGVFGARLFDSAEGSVERETRGRLVDLDYTRL
jgi:hypothetical protein